MNASRRRRSSNATLPDKRGASLVEVLIVIAVVALGGIAAQRTLAGKIDGTSGRLGNLIAIMGDPRSRAPGDYPGFEPGVPDPGARPPGTGVPDPGARPPGSDGDRRPIQDFENRPDWEPTKIERVKKNDRNWAGRALDWVMDDLTGHEIHDYADTVIEVADDAGIDPRVLFAILAHESAGRQRWGVAGLDNINVLLDRGSIGIGQMQRAAFVETALNHPEVLGRKVTREEAEAAWPDLIYDDALAIRATAYHLRDLMDKLPPDMSPADRYRMAAVGYNMGAEKMLEQVRAGKLGYEEAKNYSKTFDERFEEADRFFCKDDHFACS